MGKIVSIQRTEVSGVWLALTDDGLLWLGRLYSFETSGQIVWHELTQHDADPVNGGAGS